MVYILKCSFPHYKKKSKLKILFNNLKYLYFSTETGHNVKSYHEEVNNPDYGTKWCILMCIVGSLEVKTWVKNMLMGNNTVSRLS